jgi:hypothetical protein
LTSTTPLSPDEETWPTGIVAAGDANPIMPRATAATSKHFMLSSNAFMRT